MRSKRHGLCSLPQETPSPANGQEELALCDDLRDDGTDHRCWERFEEGGVNVASWRRLGPGSLFPSLFFSICSRDDARKL